MPEIDDLKKAGLKTTQPRLKILAALEKSPVRHVSAEDVFKLLLEEQEDIGLATVYRVLTQFETSGLVIRHNFEGGRSVFELNDADHHDHIVCLQCGHVTEFVNEDIETLQTQVSATQWHAPEDDRVFDYLLQNANTQLVDGEVVWEYKALLGK